MSYDLRELVATYERLEKEIDSKNRELCNVEGKINTVIVGVGPKVIKNLIKNSKIRLPDSMSNKRISKEQEASITSEMQNFAEVQGRFTRPELINYIQEIYPKVSVNTLNRLFNLQAFKSPGNRVGTKTKIYTNS